MVGEDRFPEWMQIDDKVGESDLQKLYDVYDKWLHIKDKGRIDIGLATALTRQMEGTPIWLFFVGPSGDAKSELVMALRDENTEILHEFTAQTLVSGFRGHEDLAPRLDDKLVVIPDMAQLLHLHPNEKGKVWAQLRELYDGRAGRQTGCSEAQYEDLRVTLIACSTPSIDNQILIFSHLGTRELIYRTNEGNADALLNKVMENERLEGQMRRELNGITTEFIKTREIKEIDPPKEVIDRIKMMVGYLRFMRAHGDIDGYTGELRNIVYPEQPTRCLKQFKRIYVALKSLSDDYPDVRALAILAHLTQSSILPIREKIFLSLYNADDWITTSKIAEYNKIGKKTTMAQLFVLWNMGLIKRKTEEFSYREVFQWRIGNKGKKLLSWISTPIETATGKAKGGVPN